MANKAKRKELHLIVPMDEYEKWEAHKQAKYNGLPAMAKMIRDFVSEGIAREVNREKQG